MARFFGAYQLLSNGPMENLKIENGDGSAMDLHQKVLFCDKDWGSSEILYDDWG